MPHLLHIDSSLAGEDSTSRRLSAEAVAAWRASHAGGTVRYRDLAADPLPHYDAAAHGARFTPPATHTGAQAAAWSLARTLTDEVRAADALVIGVPMYNWGPPTPLKTWIDHLIAPGLSRDPETQAGLLGGRRVTVISTRGGGYGPGTPREGWNHVDGWLEHVLSSVGLEAEIIEVELTLADVVPAMAGLRDAAADNRRRARSAIAGLYAAA